MSSPSASAPAPVPTSAPVPAPGWTFIQPFEVKWWDSFPQEMNWQWKPRVELSQERDILVDSLVNQQFLKKIVNSRGLFQSYLFGSYQDNKDAVSL